MNNIIIMATATAAGTP